MSLRLLHLSDPHFGACDMSIARAAVEEARQMKPDFTVISGDFSMRGRRLEFQAAADWLAQLPQPLLTIPGNHDVPGLNHIVDRFASPFRRYRKFISQVEEPSSELGEIATLVGANSSTPFGLHVDWSRGFLNAGQRRNVELQFSQVAGNRMRIFAMHHPVIGSGVRRGALVSPLPAVCEMLDQTKVDLLLAGHLHQSKVGLFPQASVGQPSRQLVVSQSPSVCSTRLKGEPNGFHLLEIAVDSIDIELWRWNGDRFSPEREFAFGRQAIGWADR